MRGPLLPVALTVVAFSAYCLYSIEKHLKFRSTGYDLGIFEQAVRNYAHLHWPYSDLKGSGYNLIGDHFHPVLLLLAPVYRLFPSPITLLVVQAAALSLSVFRIALTAQRELASPVGGAFIGIAYAFSWGSRAPWPSISTRWCWPLPSSRCASTTSSASASDGPRSMPRRWL